MEEIWKEIDGFDGYYMVSNLGNVKSLKYGKERILRQNIASNGYENVILCANNIRKGFTVHRLVAMAFIPNPDNYPDINHIDEDKTNNCANNLEWCDCKYNNNYGTGNKRRGLSNTNGKLSKPVCQYTKDGCFIISMQENPLIFS